MAQAALAHSQNPFAKRGRATSETMQGLDTPLSVLHLSSSTALFFVPHLK